MVLFVAVLSFSAVFSNGSCSVLQGLFKPFLLLPTADKEAGIPLLSFGPSSQLASSKSEPYDSCWEILFCYNNDILFPDFFPACRN